MTVNAQTPVSGPSNGNGSNRNWSFDFKVIDATDMRLRITNADGTDPVVVSTGFTIEPQYLNNDAGGVVVYPIAPLDALPAGKVITRYREVPYTQPARIGNQGAFFPKTHEDAIDRVVMQVQQVKEQADRAIVVPVGSPVIDLDELQASVQEALNAADDAENSATAAADSANIATNAASLAAGYKDDAETFAAAADASAAAAAASATSAGTSETNAAASASSAAGSETNAANSASAASSSASDANTSATNAGNSATAAAGSASAADTSADEAAASAAGAAAAAEVAAEAAAEAVVEGAGWGPDGAIILNLDDATLPAKSYRTINAPPNVTAGTFPPGGFSSSATVLVQRGNIDNYVKQTFTYRDTPATYVRVYSNSWSAWEKVLTSTNIRAPLSAPDFFERSIPLSLWECGVFGHDTSPVDETAALQAAINRAVAEKRDLAVPATKYLTSTISLLDVYELRMYGVGGRPFFLPTASAIASSGELFAFRRPNGQGYLYNSTGAEPTTDIQIGAASIVTPVNMSPRVGEYVGWTSNREWYYDGRAQWWKGEFHEVAATASGGLNIIFKDAVHDAYDVSAEVLTMHSWVASRLELHNLGFGRIENHRPEGDGTGNLSAISFNRCKNAVLDDIETYNFEGAHISQRQNDNTTAHNIRMYGSGPSADTGYGMANLAVINSRYTDIQGGGVRRLIDFSGTGTEGCGPSRNCIVDGFQAYGHGRDSVNVPYEPHGAKPSFGVGTHGPAENITFKNGKITGVGSGVTVRGRNTVLQNIEFYGWILDECISATYGEGLIVENCSYTSNDFGQKDAQGVTINAGRRAADFIAFGNSTTANRWLADDLPTVLTNNKFDGLRRSFMVLNPGQGPVFSHLTLVDNTGEVSAASGNFYFVTNLTGGDVGIHASDVWGNLALPRDDSSISCEFDNGTVYLGHRGSASLDQDRVCRVGPRSYRLAIGNNSYFRIKDMELYLAGYTQKRITVTGLADSTINFEGWIVEASAAPVVIHQGTNIEFSASPASLDGDGGTAGKLTIGMTTTGALWVENRRGGNRDVEITIG